jgi:rsbT antagonist protein RsbS
MAGTQGFHLTALGNGGALLEPQHGINPGEPGPSIEAVLRALRATRSTQLYYDLSDIAIIDTVYYDFLNQLTTACHTLGIRMTCINMQPSAAFALAAHLEQPPRFAVARGIEAGAAAARKNTLSH